ncbi:MAG: two-component regulator propeller domain-containing protein [Rhodothermales bacterium]
MTTWCTDRLVHLLILLSGTIVLAGSAFSEPIDETRYRFTRLSAQDGLSNNVVYAILQDRYGFMWIGTESGLNKYDGNSFTVYEHESDDTLSLADSRVEDLLEDEEGNIWIATRWGGLNRFDRERNAFIRYPVYDCGVEPCNRPDGLNSAVVTSLHEDASGRIWIGTLEGLARLDRESGRFEHFRHEPGNPRSLSHDKIWCLGEDAEGNLLVGTWDGGLNRLDPVSRTVTRFTADQVDTPHLTGNRIRAIESDQFGDVWIGISGGGLNRLDASMTSFEAFTHAPDDPGTIGDNKVWSILQDSRGVLWVGTYDGGLARYDRATRQFRRFMYDESDPSSIASNIVTELYEDRAGNLWVGSSRGLSIYNLAQERHQHYTHVEGDPNSLSNDDVLALHRGANQPNVLWIGTDGGGIDCFDLRTETFRRIEAPNSAAWFHNSVVTGIDEDLGGNLWIGTNGDGLFSYDHATGRTTHYGYAPDDPSSIGSNAILDVHVAASGYVWAATDGGGLSRLDPVKGTFTRYRNDPYDPTTLSDNSVQVIYEDRKGTLWIGTVGGGLNRFDRATETFTTYRHAPRNDASLSHDRIASIYEDADGILWLGTYGGLNRFDPASEQVTRYTIDEGFTPEPYFSITGDGNGALWITAANRLTYFDPETATVRHFNDRNGLSPNQYSSGALLLTHTGSIVIGGRNGFSHFRPPLPEYDQDRQPPVVFTTLKKMDEVVDWEIPSEQTVSLSYSDRFFTLEFAVLDFTNPSMHQYQYRLEGYDAGWQHMSGSLGRASYANFRPRQDEYIFRVRAANSQGAWNTVWLRLRIIPPWWQTLWFRVSAILAIGLVGGSVAMYRYNREQRVKSETLRLLTEGRERERHYLARELHDSPLQNLYSIRHKIEVLARDPADSEREKMLEDLHGVVQQTAEDLRILCGELRPPSLGPFGLEKAIRAHMRTIMRSQPNMNATLDLAPDRQELNEHLRHSLFRIYQSAITNVIRHADASNVLVRFELDDSGVLLEITDDGRGFNVPKSLLTLARSQHFGLLGISEWAEAIEANLTLESTPGDGTTVRVLAPRPVHQDA